MSTRAGILDDFWMLDPIALVWVELTNTATGTPPTGRAFHSMTSVDNKLFVFGGWEGFTGQGGKLFLAREGTWGLKASER